MTDASHILKAEFQSREKRPQALKCFWHVPRQTLRMCPSLLHLTMPLPNLLALNVQANSVRAGIAGCSASGSYQNALAFEDFLPSYITEEK